MPAEQNFWTLGTTAKYVSANPENPVKLHNGGAGTFGYKATSDVASTDNSVVDGASVTLESSVYVISASSSAIFEERLGPPVTGILRNPDLYTISGPPVSGISRSYPEQGTVDAGGLVMDATNGNVYVNEGTSAAPYYTPISFDQPGLAGWTLGRRSVGAGKAVADTATTATLPGSAIRVYGQGIEVNGDSGFIEGAAYEGGVLNTIHVTNEDAHLTALGLPANVFQPDAHGTIAVDIEFTDVADILTSAVFLVFIGAAADALDPVVTGATTTGTLALDDLAGMHSDNGYTDVDGVMLVSEKSNTAGTITSLSAVGARAAAGTYQRWRVEVDSSGYAIAFINKTEVGVIPGATGSNAHASTTSSLDADEEVSPVFYIENQTTTTRTASVKGFSTWGVIA